MAQDTVQKPQQDQAEAQPKKANDLPSPQQLPDVRIYSRSDFFYFWPVWAVGFVMAIITYAFGETVIVGQGEYQSEQWIHASNSLGVVFTFVLLAVLFMVNVSLRGMASVVAILVGLFFAVLFAWFGWWDEIISVFPYLSLYATSGFYVLFSAILCAAWIFTTFIFDKLEYWRVQPGQLSYSKVIGEAEKSYDTRGMVVEKYGEDFFRHRALGLGSGDIRIITSGARNEEIILRNVLWVDRRIDQIQRLVNVNPNDVQDVS